MIWICGMSLRILLPAGILLLAGCSSSAERSVPAPVQEAGLPAGSETYRSGTSHVQEQVSTAQSLEVIAYRPPAPVRAEPTSVVMALVEEASRQRRAGSFQQAAATLERALRIEPRNPQLWNRLANVRLDQGRISLAGDLAAKSNALARANPGLVRDNWLIIERARRSTGDNSGARSAARRARELMP